jgi:hypothetical protein
MFKLEQIRIQLITCEFHFRAAGLRRIEMFTHNIVALDVTEMWDIPLLWTDVIRVDIRQWHPRDWIVTPPAL